MGMLRSLFGPGKEEIWRELAQQLGGQYVDGGFLKGDKVFLRHGEWVMTLDTYTQSNGNSSTTYTRMRAPYVNQDGFRFNIYREGLFSPLGKLFGGQDIQIGDPFFDQQFIIKGNDERRVRQLLANEQLKQLIHAQPRISLSVRDDEGWFGTQFPEGIDELCFRCVGVIRELV